MASIKLQGDTSGELTISAPAVAGTNTLTLPASTGTLITAADVDLTNLSATNLTSGTIPDARFPATLPAISGANLTSLPSSPPPTTLYAIGTYVTGRPLNLSNYAIDTTLAGSSIYATSPFTYRRYDNNWVTLNIGGAANLVNTGTWRCVSSAWGDGSNWGVAGLWVRIS